MPEKTPLHAVIHGKIDRDEYTIEKVFFESTPGHYVSGNLYRPKGKSGKLPGVLFPHGHWEDARFFDAGEKAAQAAIKSGGEKTEASAATFCRRSRPNSPAWAASSSSTTWSATATAR